MYKDVSVLIILAAAKEIKTEIEKIKIIANSSEIDVPIKTIKGDINIVRTDLHYEVDKLLDTYENMINSKENESKIRTWRPKGV